MEKTRNGILGKIWLSFRWFHPRSKNLKIFFEPIHTETDGTLGEGDLHKRVTMALEK